MSLTPIREEYIRVTLAGTQVNADSTQRTIDLQQLSDPDFFCRWAELRHRIAVGGKSVACELKGEYAAVLHEYRRRVNRETNASE